MKNVYFKRWYYAWWAFVKESSVIFRHNWKWSRRRHFSKIARIIYCRLFIVIWEVISFLENLKNMCFCWKAWHKFFQNKLEIQKTDRYPLPLLVSVVIIYSWFVSMKHNTQLIWYFIVVVSITCILAKHKYIVYTIMIYWSIFFFAILLDKCKQDCVLHGKYHFHTKARIVYTLNKIL